MLACAAIGEIALAEIPSVGSAPPPPAAPPPGHGDYERRRKKSVRPIWDRRPDDPVLTERGSHQPDFDFTSPSVEVEDTRPALEPWTPEAILPRPPEAAEQPALPSSRLGRPNAHSRTTEDNDTAFASGVAHVAAFSSTVEADRADSYTHVIAMAHARQLDQDERATGNAWTNDDDDDDAVALLLMD